MHARFHPSQVCKPSARPVYTYCVGTTKRLSAQLDTSRPDQTRPPSPKTQWKTRNNSVSVMRVRLCWILLTVPLRTNQRHHPRRYCHQIPLLRALLLVYRPQMRTQTTVSVSFACCFWVLGLEVVQCDQYKMCNHSASAGNRACGCATALYCSAVQYHPCIPLFPQ